MTTTESAGSLTFLGSYQSPNRMGSRNWCRRRNENTPRTLVCHSPVTPPSSKAAAVTRSQKIDGCARLPRRLFHHLTKRTNRLNLTGPATALLRVVRLVTNSLWQV